VNGMWVSPIEIENILMSHEAVLECAVVGNLGEDKLVKPKAFVVLKEGFSEAEELKDKLKKHVIDRTTPFKYPRWIEFINSLPRTSTGKIQRFKLRC